MSIINYREMYRSVNSNYVATASDASTVIAISTPARTDIER